MWVPFYGYEGCGCWKSGPLITPAIPATYSPAIPATYGDTRTGAEITLSTTGSVGMVSSLGFNGGSVDASLKYQAQLEIPERLEANSFFSLDGWATLDDGHQHQNDAMASIELRGRSAVDWIFPLGQRCLATSLCPRLISPPGESLNGGRRDQMPLPIGYYFTKSREKNIFLNNLRPISWLA